MTSHYSAPDIARLIEAAEKVYATAQYAQDVIGDSPDEGDDLVVGDLVHTYAASNLSRSTSAIFHSSFSCPMLAAVSFLLVFDRVLVFFFIGTSLPVSSDSPQNGILACQIVFFET